MKIQNLEDFQAALKLIGLESLELNFVQAESDLSTIGIPRQLLIEDHQYKRFCDVLWESFSKKNFLTVPLNSATLEIVYSSEHWPRMLTQVFKALEDFMWRKKRVNI